MTMLSDGMLLGAGGPTPLAFVAATSATGSGTTLNVPLTGMSAGDLVLIFICGNSMSTASASGWTVVNSRLVTDVVRHAVLSRVLDGSEGGSVAVTVSSTTKNAVAGAWRGGSGMVDVSNYTGTGTSTISTAPSVTATKDGVLVTSFFLLDTGATVVTPPPGMVQRKLEAASSSQALYELTSSPAGVTGAKTLTWNNSNYVRGISVQIY